MYIIGKFSEKKILLKTDSLLEARAAMFAVSALLECMFVPANPFSIYTQTEWANTGAGLRTIDDYTANKLLEDCRDLATQGMRYRENDSFKPFDYKDE